MITSLALALALLGHGKPVVSTWPDHMENVTAMGCYIPEYKGAEPGQTWWHVYLSLGWPADQGVTLDGKPWSLVKVLHEDGRFEMRRVLNYQWTAAAESNEWEIRIGIFPGNEDLKAARLCRDARREAVAQILAAKGVTKK